MKAFSSIIAGLVGLAVLGAPQLSNATASILIVNGDTGTTGLNDPTPATPVGSNGANTVGQQRLIAFKFAAAIWGASLDGPVAVKIQASFTQLPCDATSAVLGAAGPTRATFSASFPVSNAWYPLALANELARQDLLPGTPPIQANFNSMIGTANCLSTSSWYYGLDGNTPAGQFDLVDVVLHEFGHGFGFLTLTNGQTGMQAQGSDGTILPDVWEFNMYDLTAQKHWSQMSDAERQASALRPRKLVWDGSNVISAVPSILIPGTASLAVSSPPTVAGEYLVGEAQFGPRPTSIGVSGNFTAPMDSGGLTTGCSPPLPVLTGKIALIDRGGCTFVAKVKNAQAAEAVAVVIADNVAGSPPGPMGGSDATITIPSVRITQSDGARLRTAIGSGTVVGNVHLLAAPRGADGQNRALLYTPDQFKQGSSVSHTDSSAILLMDPAYNTTTLPIAHLLDLTPYFLKDIGWSVTNPNPNPGNMRADIALSVAGPSNYKKGNDIKYTVTVTNNGPSDVSEVQVNAAPPAGTTFKLTAGDCVSGFPCTLGALASGANKSFTATYSVPSSYSGSAEIQLTMNAAGPLPDPVLSNNVASVSTPQTGGGCSAAGLGEPMIPAALLLLALRRWRRRVTF